LAWFLSPASAAISRIDTPAKPRSAKRRSAASRMASRVDGASRLRAVAARGLMRSAYTNKRSFVKVGMLHREGRPMSRIAVVDADGHVTEPMSLWTDYVEPAYHEWLADYCRAAPSRLFGVAMLPLVDLDASLRELERATEKLGFRGAFVRPNPYAGRPIHHPAYERFWERAAALGVPVTVHEGL